RTNGGIAGRAGRLRAGAVLKVTAAGMVNRAARSKGYLRALRETVKVKIASPEVAAILRAPAQRAAARFLRKCTLRRFKCLNQFLSLPYDRFFCPSAP